MRNLVLTFAIAVLMVACKKEDEVKPTPEPPVQEEYDCDSHKFWWIQVYQTCEMDQVSKYLLTNEESKRIDSLFTVGDCVMVNFTDYENDTASGYWLYPMYGRKSGGKVNHCYRYGKD